MRRLLALALPVVALTGVAPATAAPVATARVAVVRIALPGADGERLQLELWAGSGARGDRLEVSVTECGPTCHEPRYYAGALPARALTIDAATADAHLAVDLGGVPITVRWSPDTGTSGVVLGGIHGGGTDTDDAFSAYRGDPAMATVTTEAGACRGPAYVGDELSVWTSDAGDASEEPLSRLHLTATGRPACNG